MTDTDNADDLALIANTPARAESLLHSLEQAAEGIVFYGNMKKREVMHFKEKGAISTSNSKLLKLIDQSTYLGSNISSIENDVYIDLRQTEHTGHCW